MRIIIKKSDHYLINNNFINYVVDLLKTSGYSIVSGAKESINLLSNELNINLLEASKRAIDNIEVKETSSDITISFSNTYYYGNYSCDQIINFLTYGTRSTKGFNGILKLFEYISNNINVLYNRWIKGM